MSSFLLLFLLMLPASQDKGSLLIQTEPGTEVVWDGVTLAETDPKGRLSIEEIPLGRYTLVLRKEGFRRLQRDVEVEGGQVSLVLPLEAIPVSRPKAPSKNAPGAAKTPPSSSDPAKAQIEPKRPVLPPEFKVTEKGDVPVWPTSPQNQVPVRSTRSYAFFWLFLFLAAAMIALMATLRRRPKREQLEPAPTILPADLEEEPVEEEEEIAGEKPVSFLNELKIREELLEQGVEIVRTKEKRTVIDLDAASVREVEDKS